MSKLSQEKLALYKQLRTLQRRCEETVEWVVPQMYACFIKVLYENHMLDAEALAALVQQVQDEWIARNNENTIEDLVQWCDDNLDICLRMVKDK